MKKIKQKVTIKVTQEYGVVNINIAAPAACGKSAFAKLLDIELASNAYSLINMDNTDGVTITHSKIIQGMQALYDLVYVEVQGCGDIAPRVAGIFSASGIDMKYLVDYTFDVNKSKVQHIIITTTNVVPQPISNKFEDPHEKVSEKNAVQYYSPNVQNNTPIRNILGVDDAQYSAVELFQLRREIWNNATSLNLTKEHLVKYLQESLDFIALGKVPNTKK